MDFGPRRIRSSGAGTGSVELTLPPPFRALLGARLDLHLRDGVRPELILRPELRPAHAALERLWARLNSGCGHAPPAPPFAVADYAVGLFASAEEGAADRPGFAWAEAVELAHVGPHPAQTVASVLRALAARLARHRLPGEGRVMAVPFGAAVAFALVGVVVRPSEQELCDLAAEALFAEGLTAGEPHADNGDCHSDAFWRAAAPHLALLCARFRAWGEEPTLFAARSAAWRRGVALELSGA